MATVGSGGNYASFSLFEASASPNDTGTAIESADLQNANFEINVSGLTFTADSANELAAPTYASASTKARMSGRHVVYSDDVTVERLGLLMPSATRAATAGASNSSRYTMRRCFVKCSGSTQSIYFEGTGSGHVLSNLAIVGGNSEVVIVDSATDVSAYFVSMYIQPAGTGYRGFANYAGTLTCNACLALRGGDGNNYQGTIGGNYNASGDTSAPGSSSSKYARSESYSDWFTDIDSTEEDFALPAGRQGWWAANKDAIDRTGWPSDTDTDIAGTSRVGADVDPGCWQTPAAAATARVAMCCLV